MNCCCTSETARERKACVFSALGGNGHCRPEEYSDRWCCGGKGWQQS